MNAKALFYTLSSVGLMALWYPCIKYALTRVQPLQAAGIEILISVIVGTTLMLMKKKQFKNAQMKSLIVVGLLNAFGTICLYLSLGMLDPVMNSLLGRNYSIFCLILAVFILEEQLSGRQWSLIALSIIGGFLFVYKDTGLPSLLGITLVTAYTIFYAVGNLIAKKYCSSVEASTTVWYIKLVSLFPILIFGLYGQGTAFFQIAWTDLAYISVVSLITMYLGLNLFYKAIAESNFAIVNTLRSTGPIFVFLYSLPFFPPNLSLTNMVGGVMTIGSVALLGFWDAKKKK